VTISTHVLNAVEGAPAEGMPLRLERADGELVGTGRTNADGRCPELTEGLVLEAGIYRLRFDTGGWFADRDTATFYPTVELTFEVTDPDAHYHVPLLLSPFAFSTYRGS
jgi:5-hydroxyisourate hydrolase